MFPSFLQSRWWSTNAPLRRRSIGDRTAPWLSLINEEDWEYDCGDGFLAEVRNHYGERASQGGAEDKRKLSHRAIAPTRAPI